MQSRAVTHVAIFLTLNQLRLLLTCGAHVLIGVRSEFDMIKLNCLLEIIRKYVESI